MTPNAASDPGTCDVGELLAHTAAVLDQHTTTVNLCGVVTSIRSANRWTRVTLVTYEAATTVITAKIRVVFPPVLDSPPGSPISDLDQRRTTQRSARVRAATRLDRRRAG